MHFYCYRGRVKLGQRVHALRAGGRGRHGVNLRVLKSFALRHWKDIQSASFNLNPLNKSVAALAKSFRLLRKTTAVAPANPYGCICKLSGFSRKPLLCFLKKTMFLQNQHSGYSENKRCLFNIILQIIVDSLSSLLPATPIRQDSPKHRSTLFLIIL